MLAAAKCMEFKKTNVCFKVFLRIMQTIIIMVNIYEQHYERQYSTEVKSSVSGARLPKFKEWLCRLPAV